LGGVVQGDVRGGEDHVRRLRGVLGGEDAENIPFRGEASGEIVVCLGLGDHRSSIHEGDSKLYESGSTLRSCFAFRITKGAMIMRTTFV